MLSAPHVFVGKEKREKERVREERMRERREREGRREERNPDVSATEMQMFFVVFCFFVSLPWWFRW